jgi:hypothetical protein
VSGSNASSPLRQAFWRAIALALALSALLGALHWTGIRMPVLLWIPLAVVALVWLLPGPVHEVPLALLRAVQHGLWARDEGHFHSFGGVPLRIQDDGRDMWIDAYGMLRALRRSEPEDVFASRMPGNWMRQADDLLMLRVDAVIALLHRLPERHDPRVQRLRRYLERDVLYPAAQRRKE